VEVTGCLGWVGGEPCMLKDVEGHLRKPGIKTSKGSAEKGYA
jgi:hypothetical protein